MIRKCFRQTLLKDTLVAACSERVPTNRAPRMSAATRWQEVAVECKGCGQQFTQDGNRDTACSVLKKTVSTGEKYHTGSWDVSTISVCTRTHAHSRTAPSFEQLLRIRTAFFCRSLLQGCNCCSCCAGLSYADPPSLLFFPFFHWTNGTCTTKRTSTTPSTVNNNQQTPTALSSNTLFYYTTRAHTQWMRYGGSVISLSLSCGCICSLV